MDMAQKVLGGEPDSRRDSAGFGGRGLGPDGRVSFLPAISVNPATGLLLGVSASAIGASLSSAPPAAVYASVSYTTKRQLKLACAETSTRATENSPSTPTGDITTTTSRTYGLGPAPPSSEQHDMDVQAGAALADPRA